MTLRCYKTSYMSEWRSLVPCNHPDDTCIIFGQYSVATTAIFSSGPSTVSNLFNRENDENVEFLPLETFNMDQSPSPSPITSISTSIRTSTSMSIGTSTSQRTSTTTSRSRSTLLFSVSVVDQGDHRIVYTVE